MKAISFVLFAEELADAIIHPGILQNLGIIPTEWELAARPVVDELQTKLVFDNQVSITIQTDCIIFSENIEQRQLETLQIPTIVVAYIQLFSQIPYRSLRIVLQSEIAFNSVAAVTQYISKNLLPFSYWQSFADQSSDTISLSVVYPYKSGSFQLEISHRESASVENRSLTIDFTGKFEYQLRGQSNHEKIEHLNSLIYQWQSDVNQFTNFLQQHFEKD